MPEKLKSVFMDEPNIYNILVASDREPELALHSPAKHLNYNILIREWDAFFPSRFYEIY